MSQKLLNKRILLTDYYLRDPKLYEDIILILLQNGAFIIALLNPYTIQTSDFVKKFPKITPIVLNTYRKYEEINDTKIDLNNVTFEDGRQRQLMNSLPDVDYIINFAGPRFVEIFVARIGRSHFKLVNIEFGQIRTKLKSSTLIPEGHVNVIIHIIPDLSVKDSLRGSFGFGIPGTSSKSERNLHYVKGVPEITSKDCVVSSSEYPRNNELNPYNLSRSNILLRSFRLRIKKYFEGLIFGQNANVNLIDLNVRKEYLRRKEMEKLDKHLKELYIESIEEYEYEKILLTKIRKKTEDKILDEFTTTENATQISRERSKARRQRDMQIRTAERSYQLQLKKLPELWYNHLLHKQTKLICQITKKYGAEIKATELVM